MALEDCQTLFSARLERCNLSFKRCSLLNIKLEAMLLPLSSELGMFENGLTIKYGF